MVVHRDLADRARQRTPSAAHVTVDNFMNSPRYDEVVEVLRRTNNGADGAPAAAAPVSEGATPPSGGGVATDQSVLAESSVVLAGTATNRDLAITEAGELLVAAGAVDPDYVAAMHEREQSVSTYMGNLLAIPHGTNESKSSIHRTAISFVRYPGGVDWNGQPVEFVIGIAGAGDDHMKLLAPIAETFLDEAQVERLRQASSAAEVQRILGRVQA